MGGLLPTARDRGNGIKNTGLWKRFALLTCLLIGAIVALVVTVTVINNVRSHRCADLPGSLDQSRCFQFRDRVRIRTLLLIEVTARFPRGVGCSRLALYQTMQLQSIGFCSL
jgi:hypothetical protein